MGPAERVRAPSCYHRKEKESHGKKGKDGEDPTSKTNRDMPVKESGVVHGNGRWALYSSPRMDEARHKDGRKLGSAARRAQDDNNIHDQRVGRE